MFCLVLLSYVCTPLRLELILVVVACFAGIMGDFSWRPLIKQVEPASGVVSSSVVAPIVGEESQPVVEANFVAVEIAPSAPSFVLAKRKQDDSAGPLGHKKLKAPSSLRALRQAAGLTLDFGHP